MTVFVFEWDGGNCVLYCGGDEAEVQISVAYAFIRPALQPVCQEETDSRLHSPEQLLYNVIVSQLVPQNMTFHFDWSDINSKCDTGYIDSLIVNVTWIVVIQPNVKHILQKSYCLPTRVR